MLSKLGLKDRNKNQKLDKTTKKGELFWHFENSPNNTNLQM